MSIIVRFAGGEFPRPVDGEAKALQLRLHRGDIVARPATGVDLLFHRSIFCRHSERIPTHWVEDSVTCHRLVARQDIAHRIVANVPHVDAPRRIGKHLQNIGLGFVGLGRRDKNAAFLPHLLPVRISLEWVETG